MVLRGPLNIPQICREARAFPDGRDDKKKSSISLHYNCLCFLEMNKNRTISYHIQSIILFSLLINKRDNKIRRDDTIERDILQGRIFNPVKIICGSAAMFIWHIGIMCYVWNGSNTWTLCDMCRMCIFSNHVCSISQVSCMYVFC